jgi:hypothetical protein
VDVGNAVEVQGQGVGSISRVPQYLPLPYIVSIRSYTAKTQYRKFQTNIPREGIAAGLSPNFHIHVSVSDLYIPKIGLPMQENMWTDPRNI